jgi:hypothetical protein
VDAAYSVAAYISYASAVKMEQKLKNSPILMIVKQSSVAAIASQSADSAVSQCKGTSKKIL